jgi:peptide-methionine (S)-S-oxide reductase
MRLQKTLTRRVAMSASTAMLMLVALGACAEQPQPAQPAVRDAAPRTVAMAPARQSTAGKAAAPAARTKGEAVAIFAGGCFWCMEPPYDKLPGVISTISGYTGGHTQNPTYEQTSAGDTGHAEAVEVRYDPSKVSYEKLLDVFWHNIDPLAVDRQFCDAGSQYRSAIFPANAEQRQLAEASKRKFQQRFEQPIATQITDATTFYPAEQYHQDYYMKNPVRYKFYRFSCGRDARLEELWGKRG